MKKSAAKKKPNTVQSKSRLSGRKKILLTTGSIVVLAGLVVAGVLIVQKITGPGRVASASIIEKNPVMVGKYRYVNACQVIPEDQYKNAFGYERSTDSTMNSTFAEKSYTKKASVVSSCTTEFGNIKDDIGDGQKVMSNIGTVFIDLTQYRDTETPAQEISGTGDLKGQKINITPLVLNLNGETPPSNAPVITIDSDEYEAYSVDGIPVYYNVSYKTRFEFVYRNIYVNVNLDDGLVGKLGTSVITPDYVKKSLTTIVPVMKKSIDNQQLSQVPIQPTSLNQRVNGNSGSRDILPCDYFTNTDFKSIIGTESDDTMIDATYSMNTVAQNKQYDLNKQAVLGRGDISCKRYGLVNTDQPDPDSYKSYDDFYLAQTSYDKIEYPVVDDSVKYAKDHAEAVAVAKYQVEAKTKNYTGTKNTVVTGLGDYAAFSEFPFSFDFGGSGYPNDKHLYVAKGMYAIDIQILYKSGSKNVIRMGSDAQYKQAAQLLLARLPN